MIKSLLIIVAAFVYKTSTTEGEADEKYLEELEHLAGGCVVSNIIMVDITLQGRLMDTESEECRRI